MWLGVVQLLKTVGAAVAAWLLAVRVFGLGQPFLAPWSALLVVHATVHRTLSRGMQQVGATVLGVLVASALGAVLGVGAASLAAVLLVSLAMGHARSLRPERATVATTALIVLLAGYSDDEVRLLERLADTGIGIGVGLAVNLLVWPPLRDRVAARRIDRIDNRIGELLIEIAVDLRAAPDDGYPAEDDPAEGWVECTRQLDEDLDDAWAIARQAWESGRWNARPGVRARMERARGWDDILRRLEQSIADCRSMARTLSRGNGWPAVSDPRFRGRWTDLLEESGRVIVGADRDGVRRVQGRLDQLSADLSEADVPIASWPVYGALIANLRNVSEAMDEVAAAQPVTAGRSAHLRVRRP